MGKSKTEVCLSVKSRSTVYQLANCQSTESIGWRPYLTVEPILLALKLRPSRYYPSDNQRLSTTEMRIYLHHTLFSKGCTVDQGSGARALSTQKGSRLRPGHSADVITTANRVGGR